MADTTDVAAMRRAIELSARGALTTPPNPDVGCVVLDAMGEVAGEGWHERAGGPHAEIHALNAAGSRARGGTAVVTLEPCAHTGRTSACVDALIEAGIRRVVVAVLDPNDEAAGGVRKLADHGIDVETGVLADEAATANERWLMPFHTARPFVVWKFATTLDGRSAAADGSSRWITGAEARTEVHRLRAAVDTIVVGAGTVLGDDPQLTARTDEDSASRQPLRVVVDSEGRTPPEARVLDDAAPTWIATADAVGNVDGRVDLTALLAELYRRGRRYVLVEGGPTLAGAFVGAGLVDRFVAYVAPALLGAGKNALDGAGIDTIGEAVRLDVNEVTVVGGDVRITGRRRG